MEGKSPERIPMPNELEKIQGVIEVELDRTLDSNRYSFEVEIEDNEIIVTLFPPGEAEMVSGELLNITEGVANLLRSMEEILLGVEVCTGDYGEIFIRLK